MADLPVWSLYAIACHFSKGPQMRVALLLSEEALSSGAAFLLLRNRFWHRNFRRHSYRTRCKQPAGPVRRPAIVPRQLDLPLA